MIRKLAEDKKMSKKEKDERYFLLKHFMLLFTLISTLILDNFLRASY